MRHVLHSVLVSYNRRDLTEIALASFQETIDLPYTLTVVDNGSDLDTVNWLGGTGLDVLFLGENRYPGYATNRGWERAPGKATLLHRIDNDFRFLPGWCDEVVRMFDLNPRLGQLGLRTDAEELWASSNVGGNCVIRRAVWEQGLRYDERPWGEYPTGHTEDSFFTPELVRHGWDWDRVERPCIECTANNDLTDPYYQETFRIRGILPPGCETRV